MSALQKIEHSDLIVFSDDQVGLIKRTIARGASDDELKLFLHQCQKTGLDPLAKQIYFQKRKTKNGDQVTIITGIDGYRLIADRTGNYAGNDDPIFDNEESPRKATVTVYKIVKGVRCPYSATARWSQYYPGEQLGFLWRKMPHLMLGKCAEALALRKAFPAELSGMYVKEEMDQAEPPIEAEVIQEGVSKSAISAPTPTPTPTPNKGTVYTGEGWQQEIIQAKLKGAAVPEVLWPRIDALLKGKPSGELNNVVKLATEEAIAEGAL